MRALIAFFILTVAVLRESEGKSNLEQLAIDFSNACVRELNRDARFISDNGPSSLDACILDDPNYILCMDKKFGVMNEDGTYNLDRMLSLSDTEEAKQNARKTYDTKIKNCSLKVGNDPCKMAACVHRQSDSLCGRVPSKEDGC